MGTLIVGAVVLALFVLAIVVTYRRKKRGNSCYGGCKNCASSSYCHPNPDDKTKN